MKHDEEVKQIHGRDLRAERQSRDLKQQTHSYDSETRRSQELGDLERNNQADMMAKQRRQVMEMWNHSCRNSKYSRKSLMIKAKFSVRVVVP